MGTISTRVPDELEAYLEEERLDRSTAVRKLLAEGLERWRREQALERVAAGESTLSKAAQHAGMSVWEFARFAEERDVTWVSSDHLESDLEGEPLDLAAPDDVGIYDSDATSIASDDGK